MKWENLPLFREMERIIYSLENNANPSSVGINSECQHEYQNVDDAKVCIKCGEVQYYLFDNSGNFEIQKPYKAFRPYERTIHLKNLMRRVSGYKFIDGKEELKVEEIPESLNQIRKLLKQKKMNIKNDFYYWRMKNNVEQHISKNDCLTWSNEYCKKRNVCPKDFLYEKMHKKEEYQSMLKMIEKKKNIKKTQTDLKK